MKNIKLSNRLAAVADFIGEGACVADIGTDHGYIPVYLAQTGLAGRIIASDIKTGPLDSARRTAREYGVFDKITFVTAPGLRGVGAGDADTIVIAGMGGELIAKIIEDAPWTKRAGVRLILQPQTKMRELCTWLLANGYVLRDASLAEDSGRLYTVILAESGECGFDAETALTAVLKNDPLYSRYINMLAEREHRICQARAGASRRRIGE